MSALSLRTISKTFEATPVLRDLSLEISSGEFFFLLGPSGCGKSTLLRIIAGLEQPDSGTVTIDGQVVNTVPPQKRGIGMVFQNYALWPHMTVAQNITFGLENQGLTKAQRLERLDETLELVRMETFSARFPHEISGGQQQRVALARALALRPKIILLDEPLSNLDATLRVEIREELVNLHGRLNTTMVYVTHDQEDALAMGSRIALLREGRIEQVGSPRELYTQPASVFAARFLGDSNLLPCRVVHPSSSPVVKLDDSPEFSTQARSAVSITAEQRGFLCVRPESLRFQSDGTGLPATVVRRVFRGSGHDITVRLDGGTPLRGFIPHGPDMPEFRADQSVVVSWDPSVAIFLPR